MPEITPVWIDGYYDSQAEADSAMREGLEGTKLEPVPTPALTLDQIEEWLGEVRTNGTDDVRRHFSYRLALADLLAQVQAWRKGDRHE
jgi:hypothetical protein